MAPMPPPPPPPPPPPVPDEIGFDAILDGLSNGPAEENKSAGLPSFAGESNGVDNSQALVKAPEQKSWEKPLSIPEIRKSSNNWSLASDAGLLLYLQEFSQKMMTKTSDLEKRVDGLVHDAKSADSRAQNTFNDFLMLANTQFIENRVYDDSEDVDAAQDAKEKKENQTKTREQREAEVIPRVIQALTLGINVLDTGFEHLDANAGNSDSEDEDPTYKVVDPILEAKDMYAHRSLPYIIGTPAFMQDDDVGLLDLSEEEAGDDESSNEDTLSDSDKSDLSDIESADQYTDTETESEFTGGQPRQTADTTATSTNKSDSEDSDGGLFDDEDSQPSAPAKPMNFQDELAAKLGGGAPRAAASAEAPAEQNDDSRNRSVSEDSKESSHSSKKGTRRKKLPMEGEKRSKKKRSPSKTEEENPFGEQPGQEEAEAEDSPFGRKGLFSSSGGGLFDDDKEDEGGLFDEKPSAPRKEVTSDHVYEDIVANPEESRPVRKAPPGGVPLFGAGGGPEDELFGSAGKAGPEGESRPEESKSGGLFAGQENDPLFSGQNKAAPKKGAGKPRAKKPVDLFGEEDDSDLFGEGKPQQKPPKKKIPVGAVNVFGSAGPVGGQTEPPPLEDDGDEGMYVNTMVGAPGAGRAKTGQTPLGGGLFDNVDEDLFGVPSKPAEKSKAQNDSDKLFADDNEDDLFAAPPPLPKDDTKAAAKKNQGLFDDIEETGEDDLFAATSKAKEPARKKPPGGVALFEGSDIFGSPPKVEVEPPAQNSESSPNSKANRTQNTLSLFNEDDEKDEELFGEPPAPPPKRDKLEPNTKEEQLSRRRTKSKSIFDDEAILFGLKNEENPGVDLFGSDTPVPQPKTQSEKDEKSGSPRKPRSASASQGLFGDDDDGEDDLFATAGSKKSGPPASSAKGAPAAKEKKKKSQTLPVKNAGLFGDDEEDDLFAEPKPKKTAEKKKKEEGKKKDKQEEKKDPEKDVKMTLGGVDDPLGGGVMASAANSSTTAKEEPAPPSSPSVAPPPAKQSKKPPAGAVSMFGGMDPSSFTKKKEKEEIDDDIAFEAKSSPSSKPSPKPAAKPPSPYASSPLFAPSSPPSHDSPDYAVAAPRIKPVAAPKGKSTGAIGKVKANMAIDPTALRPGAAPPAARPESASVGFDQPANFKTLDNPTKTRARVSAKRRPPSRKSLQAAAAAASGSNPSFWSDSTGEDDGFRTFTQNLASDQPDIGASAASAKPEEPRTREPVPAAKPKKPVPPPEDIFGDDLYANTSGDAQQSSTLKVSSSKEERPFSIEGESDLFAPKPSSGDKKQQRRTLDLDDDLFAGPSKVGVDASIDDIFATPPAPEKSSKPSTDKKEPAYEDIFASDSKSKRSTLTDLAVDEDLFGDSKPKGTSSAVSIDEDLFGTPPPAPSATASKPKKKKVAKKTAVLEDDDDLFAEKPKKTKAKPAKATDDDLFADTTDIFADIPASKPKKKKKAGTEDSIFKDVQGDDIFAEPVASKPKKTKAKKKAAKETTDIFSTDAPNIFDDPLNAINN